MSAISNTYIWEGKADLSVPYFADSSLLEDNFTTEAFSQWLEEKLDLPLLQDLSTTSSVNSSLGGCSKFPEHYDTTDFTQQDTESLLREFECVYDKVELNHFTPPHSPTLLFYSSEPEQYNHSKHSDSTYDWDTTFCDEAKEDICQGLYSQSDFDMASIAQHQGEDTILINEESSLIDQVYDQAYESSFSNEEKTISSPENCGSVSSSDLDDDWIPTPHSSKHSYKPYRRPERGDRRNRKKEQNKNAATRYRQKKKAQIEEILSMEHDMLESNKKLQAQCTDIEREIKYLKDLMRELFKAKGLLK